MRKRTLLSSTIIAASLVSAGAEAQTHQVIEKEGLKMHVYTSKPVIFEVASVLLEGKNEVVLIDAQFSKDDAQNVVDLIKSTGKELTKIFISYSDPDFYFGLDYIATQFPKAALYATPQTAYLIKASEAEKMAIWSPVLGENAPKKIIIPTSFGDDYFLLDDKRIEIKKILNDEQHSFLWIPSVRAVLGGIYLDHGAHLWVADSQTKADRSKWLAGLEFMEKLNPDYAIPAHFSAGKTDLKGKSAIQFTKNYLIKLEEALGKSLDSEEVIRKMKSLYPDLDAVSNLEMSAKVIKGEEPWTTLKAYPAIARKAKVDFGGDFVFELNFKDDKHMTFTSLSGSLKGVKKDVDYTAVEVAPNVYMVYWIEPDTNTHVVHLQDYGAEVAYTNISAPDGSFTNLKGTIKLLDQR